jgi:HAD superfamily hydrolase (TIGR01509 family)
MSRARLLVAVLVMLLLAGCRADVTVWVAADDDGSGVVDVQVVLDGEAVDRLDGVENLRTGDLVEAGWAVQEPVDLDDGGLRIEASKPFADPAELSTVLTEISGPAGPYAQLGLTVDRPFGKSELRFEGALDGSVGVDAFADPGVAAALDGLPFGTDLTALEAELGVPPGSLVHLDLVVALPGEITESSGTAVGGGSDATGDASDDESVRWATDLAATAPVPVLAASEVTRWQPLVLAAIAIGLGVVFVLLLVARLIVGLRRRRKRRRAAKRRRADRAVATTEAARYPDPAPVVDDTAEVVAEEAESEGGLEMVVLGGPGATFSVRDEVDELVAFARSHGSRLEYPKISELYGDAIRGRLSTAELWEGIGVAGDAELLDEEFLGRYSLTPGLREFVARARDNGFRVAYLGDGPAAWASRLRHTFMLNELVEPWVVSADVGAALPEVSLFEAVRRISAVEPANCLFIDDRLRVLEAAHAAGFGTAWFAPSGRAVEAPGHSIIRSFSDLLSG